jgi:protein subunit release factor B
MLDAYIIEEIKKREREEERRRERENQIPLHLPLEEYPREEEKKEDDVTILDTKNSYKIIDSYRRLGYN